MRTVLLLFLTVFLNIASGQSNPCKIDGEWIVCKLVNLDSLDKVVFRKNRPGIVCRENKWCEYTKLIIDLDRHKIFVDYQTFGCPEANFAQLFLEEHECLFNNDSSLLYFSGSSFNDILGTHHSFSIAVTDSTLCLSTLTIPARKKDLINYIKNAEVLDDICASTCECQQVPTTLYLKQDSLFRGSSLEESMKYFEDSSYILKCYAIPEILFRAEDVGWKLIREHIRDTTRIADWSWDGYICFNEFIVGEYLAYLKARYYYGGNGTYGFKRRYHQFGTADKKRYRRKLKELKDILNQANIQWKFSPNSTYLYSLKVL